MSSRAPVVQVSIPFLSSPCFRRKGGQKTGMCSLTAEYTVGSCDAGLTLHLQVLESRDRSVQDPMQRRHTAEQLPNFFFPPHHIIPPRGRPGNGGIHGSLFSDDLQVGGTEYMGHSMIAGSYPAGYEVLKHARTEKMRDKGSSKSTPSSQGLARTALVVFLH